MQADIQSRSVEKRSVILQKGKLRHKLADLYLESLAEEMKVPHMYSITPAKGRASPSPPAAFVPVLPASSASPVGQAGLFANAFRSQTHTGHAMVLRGSLLSNHALVPSTEDLLIKPM